MSAQLSFQSAPLLPTQPIVQFRPRRLSLSSNTSASSSMLTLLPVEGVIHSQALFKGQREILIKHGDRVYRLRHTSNDKLILTK